MPLKIITVGNCSDHGGKVIGGSPMRGIVCFPGSPVT